MKPLTENKARGFFRSMVFSVPLNGSFAMFLAATGSPLLATLYGSFAMFTATLVFWMWVNK